MKATIKRIIKPNGDHFFQVWTPTGHFSSHYYEINSDYATEEKAMGEAMKSVKIIESDAQEIEEIVYETPDLEKATAGIDLSKIDEI